MAKNKHREPIWEARKAKGWTIDRAATEFGVNRRTLIRWEDGATPLPVERLEQAERIYGVKRIQLRPDIFEGVA